MHHVLGTLLGARRLGSGQLARDYHAEKQVKSTVMDFDLYKLCL